MDGNRISGPYRATRLWSEMVHIFCTGVPLKKHRRHIRVYENCFTASEAVNWFHKVLQRNQNFDPTITKEQTIQLLNKFLLAGVFQKVNSSYPSETSFKENGDIYQLCTRLPPSDENPFQVVSSQTSHHNHKLSNSTSFKGTTNVKLQDGVYKRFNGHPEEFYNLGSAKEDYSLQQPVQAGYNEHTIYYVHGLNAKANENPKPTIGIHGIPVNRRNGSSKSYSECDNSSSSGSLFVNQGYFQTEKSKCCEFSNKFIQQKQHSLDLPLKACFFNQNTANPQRDIGYTRNSQRVPISDLKEMECDNNIINMQNLCTGRILGLQNQPVQYNNDYCGRNDKNLILSDMSNWGEPPNKSYRGTFPNPSDIQKECSNDCDENMYTRAKIKSYIVDNNRHKMSEISEVSLAKNVSRRTLADFQNTDNFGQHLRTVNHPVQNVYSHRDIDSNLINYNDRCSAVTLPYQDSKSVIQNCNNLNWNHRQSSQRPQNFYQAVGTIPGHAHSQGMYDPLSKQENKISSRDANKHFERTTQSSYALLPNEDNSDAECNSEASSASSTLMKRKHNSKLSWKSTIFERLQELLPEVPVAELLPSNVPFDWILQNATQDSLPDAQLPHHILSAIKTPTGVTSDALSDIQSYFCNWTEPLLTFSMYEMITQAYMFIESMNLSLQYQSQDNGKIMKNLPPLLTIGGCKLDSLKPSDKISDARFQQILGSKQLLKTVLPPNLCFETAFTSDSPITRIVPQQSMDTIHLSFKGQKDFGTTTAVCRQTEKVPSPPSVSTADLPTVPVSSTVSLKRNASAPNLLDVTQKCSSRPLAKHSKSMRETQKPTTDSSQRPIPRVKPILKSGKYGWYRNRRAPKEPIINHLRSKSGGYINPALSQSVDDDAVSQDLASVQLDYEAALQTLSKLMDCSRDPVSLNTANKNRASLDSSNSETSSYYTATSSADSSPRSSRSITDTTEPQKLDSVVWTYSTEKLFIEVLQIILLFIPPHSRTRLKLLLNFMKQLAQLSFVMEENSQPTVWDLPKVISAFSPCLISSEFGENFNRELVEKIVSFMITHQDNLLIVPLQLSEMVQDDARSQRLLTESSKVTEEKVTFCEQVSSQQFEKQRLTSSQIALSELLEQILSDRKMKLKERKKRLKMFKESYPHIYNMRFPNQKSKEAAATEKHRSILHFPTFTRLRSIRV